MRQLAVTVLKSAGVVLVAVGFVALLFGLTIAREIPTGSVAGRILDENGRPFARVTVTVSNEHDSRSGTTDVQGRYLVTDVPVAASYGGYAAARGYETASLSEFSYAVQEGTTTTLRDVQLQPRPPAIYSNISSTFLPGQKVKFALNGYSRRPVAQVHVSVYRYDFAQRVRDRNGRSEPYEASMKDWRNLGAPVYERDYALRTDSEGYFSRDVRLPVKDVGGYLVHIRLESTERLLKTLITDLALVAKRAPGKTLVYAASFIGRKPLAGAKLEFFDKTGKVASGVTGRDGVFVTGSLGTESITMLGSHGGSDAINHTYSGGSESPYKCYMYTDRPVYRPGHKVQFRGILRSTEPGRLEPVSGQSVSVKIVDPEDNTVKTMSLDTSRFGTFHGEVDLSTTAAVGHYSIVATHAGSEHYSYFNVEEYRKPEFKAAVSFARTSYVGGGDIDARVEATYYFGAPVTQARVKYTIYKSPDYFYYYPDEDSDTSFYDEFMEDEYESDYGYGYGEVVLEGESATGDDGVCRITVPTRKTAHEQRYLVEATVTDASGRSVDVSGGVLVTPALYTFAVETDRWFYKPGQRVTLNLYAVDYNRKRVPNVSASIRVREEYRFAGERRRTILTRTVRFDRNGRATVRFTPRREGSFEVRVLARDRQRNAVVERTSLWVASDNWSGEGYQPPGLEVKVDKKLYNVGDVARVMINCPDKGCHALFTIEGRRLFQHRVIALDSTSTVIELPVLPEYLSNVYASVCIVKGKKFISESTPIFVSPKTRFLNVSVSTDKGRYLPGEAVTYTVRTTDATGRGVPAEVSLGVVDESLYAIREDRTQDIRKFFYGPSYNAVETSISFSEDYYGGEDKFAGKVRKYFPDTAYWNPTVLTDDTGQATVTFDMPDNLTTWRATARAVTMDTWVGSTVHKVLVTKNLLVRLQTPRFFRQRDSTKLLAAVHNYTEREQRVRVWIEASGIRVEGSESRTIVLGPRGAGTVEWRAEVPHPGSAAVTVYAQGQGHRGAIAADQDAMQLEVPILPHGVEEVVSTSGASSRSAEFALNVPRSIIRDASVLRIGLSSSIAGAALGITRAIEDYSYDTAEGIMDVLLPNVVMYQAMEQMGVASREQYEKVRKLVEHDLSLVYRWQLPGGGWGWSEYGSKDPWMTAYVLYGLLRAREAGIAVRDDAVKSATQAVLASIPDEGDLGKKATMVYVLSLAGVHKDRWISEVLRDKHVQNYSLSLMMLSLARTGQMDRARALIPKLERGAVETGLHCYWPEVFEWGFYSCNRYETTAYAIRALLAVDPSNPRIAKAVRWLLSARKGDRYEGNYDTASVVYALADYLMVHKPPVPNYTARVYVNGKLVREVDMDAQSISKPELVISVRGRDIREGANRIRIEKTGPGEVFYWGLLTYYSSAEDVAARRGKISIRRSYYRLELVRDPNEGLVYKPAALGETAHVGEIVRCRLTITSPKDFRYLIVEDMLPSGCEVVQRESAGYYGDWDYWWTGETIHDNRITFLLADVYDGRRQIEYDFRPELRGTFHVMPATAKGSFEPDIYAHSDERKLVVE